MEPYIGSDYDAIRGYEHTSFAETDVTPDRFEFWLGPNLLGTTYPASSSGTTTTFTYDYDAYGGVNGVARWVRVKAFKGSASDSKGYWLTVWANPAVVVTTSRSVADQPEVGGTYSVSFTSAAPNSAYTIERMEVWVDGAFIVGQDYGNVGSATITADGTVPLTAGPELLVEVRGVVKVANAAWNGVLKLLHARHQNTIAGVLECSLDHNPLDSGSFNVVNGGFHDNATWVVVDPGSAAGGEISVLVSTPGYYKFDNNVPVGHNIEMWMDAEDTHVHGYQAATCVWDMVHTWRYLGQVGKVVWGVFPVPEKLYDQHFSQLPNEVTWR